MRDGLISTRARQSLETVLERAVRARLVLREGDHCTIARAGGPDAGGVFDDSGVDDSWVDDIVVVLTIASMGFRYMMFLRFRDDPASAAYFSAYFSDYFSADIAPGRALRNALLELGNLCCGAVNQELGRHFPDLGMSTPYVLGGHSLAYIDSLQPDYRADLVASISVASIESAVTVGATMCLFTRVPIDFHAGEDVEMAGSDGALELF